MDTVTVTVTRPTLHIFMDTVTVTGQALLLVNWQAPGQVMDAVKVTFTEKAPLLGKDPIAFTITGHTLYVVMSTAITSVAVKAPCLVTWTFTVTDKVFCLGTGPVKDEVTRNVLPLETDRVRVKRQAPRLKIDTVTDKVTHKASHLVT